MNILEIDRITRGQHETLYLYDDYNDAALKLEYDKKIRRMKAFVKWKGKEEKEVDSKNPHIYEMTLYAGRCTKEFYDNL